MAEGGPEGLKSLGTWVSRKGSTSECGYPLYFPFQNGFLGRSQAEGRHLNNLD
jgi:hypothetical protein